MNRDEALATLAVAGLSRVTDDLPNLMCDAIRLTTSPADEGTLPLGATKLGGQPDMPAGTVWPLLKGLPMSFIAQVRLEDAHPYDTARALPPSGLLSFFYDAQQQTFGADPQDRGGWQVFYSVNTANLQRMPLPPNLPTSARFIACAVAFSSEVTLAQDPKLELPNLSWRPDELKAYENALATFPTQEDHAAIHNRLLGHPDTLQDDMRQQCQLASNGINDPSDPRAAELMKGAMNWRLLLQVDSDEHAGMRWGDAGMLYYWIEQDALQAHRFDNTWVMLQSD